LLILATTTARSVLDSLNILNSFDAEIAVPNVATLSEMKSVLERVDDSPFSPQQIAKVMHEVKDFTQSDQLNVGVKKLLMAIETARQDPNMLDRFVTIVRKAAMDMMLPQHQQLRGGERGRETDVVGEIYDGY